MKSRLFCHAMLVGLPVALFAHPACAERWSEYYRTGSGQPVEWDLNEIDLDSIKRVGQLHQYTVRVRYADGKTSAPMAMQVDCAKQTRGQLPDPFMRNTYHGTLGREEVKAVCFAVEKERK